MTTSYLHGVDDGEPVGGVGASVHHSEVVPLRVFVGVKVIPKPQLVLVLPPERRDLANFNKDVNT